MVTVNEGKFAILMNIDRMAGDVKGYLDWEKMKILKISWIII